MLKVMSSMFSGPEIKILDDLCSLTAQPVGLIKTYLLTYPLMWWTPSIFGYFQKLEALHK